MSEQEPTHSGDPFVTSPYQPAWQPTTSGTPPPPPGSPGAPPRPRGKQVSRRNLLIGAGAVGVGAAAITTGLLAWRGQLHLGPSGPPPVPASVMQTAHLLRRAGFGGRMSELQQYAALGYSGAVDHLINYAQVTDDIDTRLQGLNLDLTRVADEQRWWILRMIYSKRPFQEKMTLFWHGLLTSSYQKVGGRANYGYLITQNRFLRDHALDTYDHILLGMTQDPAMMWWLDLRLSKKNAPNENFARELMELFTLGVSGGYTQQDVHEAARALTGFHLAKDGSVVYDPAQHDSGSKTLLGQTGNLDYKDVIRIVASHPATGPYLCRRIFQFFAHENPSDAELQPMIDAYTKSGHSMKAVMQALFLSPAFQSAAAYRSRLKSPVEFVIGTIRQLELETPGQGVSVLLEQMGQNLLAPPNVAGWTGDQSSEDWINTGTWLARVNFINGLLTGFKTGKQGAYQGVTQTLQSVITANKLAAPTDVLNHFVALLLDGQIATDRLQVIHDYLTATDSGPTLKLAGGGTIPASGVSGMVYLLMSSPEYHLN